MKHKFSGVGVGVALVTPMQVDGSIDYNDFGKLLAHTTRIGVNYWVVQGTTGESPTVSSLEKLSLLRYAQENNPKHLPIVFGVGGNNTQEIIETLQKTALDGVDAILSVAPYYNKPTPQGMLAHYRAIADASPVPVILYNVPGRTGINMPADLTLHLAEHPNIIAIKEASGNLLQCMEIMRHKPEDFLLISGDDLLTLPMIAIGAAGVISVMGNAIQEFNEMVHLALENNFKAASQKAFELLSLNELLYLEGNPTGIKNTLKHLEICQDYVRLPLAKASEQLESKIVEALRVLQTAGSLAH